MMNKDKVEAQQKMEAWMEVGRLCERAAAVLCNVNEGPMVQAQLLALDDKARVQANLWNTGGE